jgi:hypothetical protein
MHVEFEGRDYPVSAYYLMQSTWCVYETTEWASCKPHIECMSILRGEIIDLGEITDPCGIIDVTIACGIIDVIIAGMGRDYRPMWHY